MAVVSGDDFEMMSIGTTQERIDNDKVKALLTPEQLAGCVKEISFVTIKTTRKDSSKKPKFAVPNLANATPQGLVDMLGDTREKMKELEKLEGIYKEALKAFINQKVPDENNSSQ